MFYLVSQIVNILATNQFGFKKKKHSNANES
jgi:hypothetical protein